MSATDTPSPSLLQRLGYGIGSIFRGFHIGASTSIGHWEGHERNRLRARPTARLESQDDSLDCGTREKMTAEARVLCQLFPLSKRILRKFTAYTVGDCRYKWNTGNPEHDARFRDYLYNWMDRADASGRHKLPKLASLAVTSMLRDGDIFASLVPAGPRGRDVQIRLIEADRVGNYRGGMLNIDDADERITGGILIDASGRPAAYRVNTRSGYSTFKHDRDIPAGQVFHMYDPDRVDAVRGVTAFHCALNHMRDMKETIDAEKSAIKQHSKIALLVKSVAGGARSGIGGLTLNANSDTSDNSAVTNVEEINDAMTKYMFPSEDIKAFQSTRPDKGWMDFQNLMLELIAVGFSLPVSVVMQMSGTGPAVRHDMSDAQRTFNGMMDTLEEKFLDPVVAFVTANAIERRLLPQNPNWHKFERQRPPAITIDMGRESQAAISENEAWLRTGSDIANESGMDHDENVMTIAAENGKRWRAAEAEAKRTGAPIEFILNPSAFTKPAAAPAPVPSANP